ncbi:MAG: prephenate dehydratase domain-containing protein [Clostridiaceae bacterium]|nr:prephenate dehydratase domain-containing protein [Clostridiaceae bacterium]
MQPDECRRPVRPDPDLAELRRSIEELDEHLVDLFSRRMEIARSIGAVKVRTGAPVFDPAREDAIVARVLKQAGPQDARRVESLLRGIMRLSRSAQYEHQLNAGAEFPLGRQIVDAPDAWPSVRRIIYQGTAGSYSEQASRLLFPAAETVRAATFADACDRVHEGLADAAVLPLENSTAGTVDDVYDLLLQNRLYLWRSLSLPIHHQLLACPGASLAEITTVLSHPQALAQCSDLIRRQGWSVQETANTAFAAESVAAAKDRSLAALASEAAALAYGLQILQTDVNNVAANQTRFIAVGRDLVITPDAGRVSLILSLPHLSGSLAAALSIFSDRGLNLSKIQSRPDLNNPWAYFFYLDFESRSQDLQQTLAALYQLSREMPFLRLLGWYGEERLPEGGMPVG